jgi:isoamylase
MAKKKINHISIAKGMPIPFGSSLCNDGIHFAVSLPNTEECKLNLYDAYSGDKKESVTLDSEYKWGSVYSVLIKEYSKTDLLEYTYQINEKEFVDPYAKLIKGREIYGKQLSLEEKQKVRGVLTFDEYPWKEDKQLKIPFHDLIIYKLHVRGFTKHNSSSVEHKGTFLGLMEKIPYLLELGINCVQLMPIYEYNEVIEPFGCTKNKINYWGYGKDNYYFAPKSSYASNPNQAIFELKTLVETLHKNGIEVIMEMYFENGTNYGLIQDCLRFWHLEYHVDGFRFNSDAIPTTLLATDPILANVKLLTEGWNIDQIYAKDYEPKFKNLAEYNVGFSNDARRYLRGDEEQVGAFVNRFSRNQNKCAVINFITNHDGFTLMDLYSYDYKHNEVNGENNNDGPRYNYSWNCGLEGPTNKKKILDIRKKMIRNALTTLLFSQGTPLLLAGDEFGNSQKGNNNPYCQDNDITWLDWSLLKINQDLFIFLKELIRIRKEHPILHREDPLRSMDYISCGFPDVSYHGVKAWYPDYSYYNRMLGIMLSGQYVLINRKENDKSFYIAFNMHWEKHQFDLPYLPVGEKWYPLLNTETYKSDSLYEYTLEETKPLDNQRQVELTARSIIILIGK